MPFFNYLAQHPEQRATFDAAMTGLSAWKAEAVAASYGFADTRTVVDVGSGQGVLLARPLGAYPRLHGVLFDQPATTATATAVTGDPKIMSRCQVVGGDFFQAVPEDGDSYLLKYIVHDWDDEHAVTILRNCRTAMADRARVLLIETVVPGPGTPHFAKIQDVEMLVLLGSRERTADEYAALLERAGLRPRKVIPTPEHLSIVEAEAGRL
jgi:hypothetical protein